MLGLTRTYTDYNGTERTETFYFHFSELELEELRVSESGGLDKAIERIVAAQDGREIIRIMKDILLKAYGKKSDDGRGFIKNDRIREEFEGSPVFSDLFMELSTDEKKAAKFFEDVLPKKTVAAMKKAESKQDNITNMPVATSLS